jgi:hypothetical protein
MDGVDSACSASSSKIIVLDGALTRLRSMSGARRLRRSRAREMAELSSCRSASSGWPAPVVTRTVLAGIAAVESRASPKAGERGDWRVAPECGASDGGRWS